MDVVPLVLNGAIGAHLHVPFAVAVRSSFGYYFARFAIVTRLITALFWHGKCKTLLIEHYVQEVEYVSSNLPAR
jgi:cytosine/uracil/thiamine/allantoin permease